MTLTIQLTDDELRQLNEKARSLNSSAEELVGSLVRQLVQSGECMDVDTAIDRVLKKNQELYKRLA